MLDYRGGSCQRRAVRWDQLFTDLENQFADLHDAERLAQLADQQRYYAGQIGLVDRLQGALGVSLSLRLVTGQDLLGRLQQVGPDWVLMHASRGHETLVPLAAVVAVRGLTGRTGVGLSRLDRRIDLRLALRGLARDRAPVRLELAGNSDAAAHQFSGTIDRVGRDFVELAQHGVGEFRRAEQVRGVVLIPLSSLVVVHAQSG